MLIELNENEAWRKILSKPIYDLHGNDIEMILRSIALLVEGENYTPKMAIFLNKFSEESKKFNDDYIEYLKELFIAFINACSNLEYKAFFRNNRFSKSLFESIFVAVCYNYYQSQTLVNKKIDSDSFEKLKNDDEFINSLQSGVLSSEGIKTRRERALQLIKLTD